MSTQKPIIHPLETKVWDEKFCFPATLIPRTHDDFMKSKTLKLQVTIFPLIFL